VSLFNRNHKSVLSIDISTVAVKLLEMSKTGNRYKIESFTSIPFFQSPSPETNIANANVIAEALEIAFTRSQSKLKQATVAVSGSAVITKIFTMPASLTEEEIEGQIMIEADQYVPYSLDELNYDFEVQGANINNHEMVDVLFVASRRENVDERVEALAKAGLKANIVDVETFAMENAFSLLPDYSSQSLASQTVAVADIGATLSNLTVFHKGRAIYTREQEFGGKQLTEEIQHRYGLSFEEAELKKIQGGLPENYLIDVLEPFKRAMVQQIQRSLQFFISSNTNRDINCLVLAGGCASINNVDKLIEHNLRVPVYIANPLLNLSLSNKIKPETLYNIAPALMIVCGLALRSFD
jgi:type IV pilus assembly protein PilM